LKLFVRNLIWLVVATAALCVTAAATESSGQDDPLDYERALKQHHLKLSRYVGALSSHVPSANQNQYDVTYYNLSFSIDADQKLLTGKVEVHGQALEPLTSVELDLAANMGVDSVFTGSLRGSFERTGAIVTILTAAIAQSEEFDVTVFYSGSPIADGFGSFSFATHNGLPLVSTLSEPFFARNWWPCKDHPSDKADSVDLRVTIDNRLKVASNGTLMSIVNNGDGTNTTHWHESYPIATYLVSLAIADYEHYADTFYHDNGAMPVDFYILSGNVERLRANNDLVVRMLEYFTDVYGEYPFIREKYGHAQFLFGGGMEHQTCSSMGAFHDWVIAHELAHQWWGDMITCGTWHDIWLNEGFARYSEALWIYHTNGAAAYHQYMNSLIRIDQQVYVEDTTETYVIFDRVVYDKGALVLHMLRYLVGEDTFFAILRAYAESKHKYGTATTEDFRVVCEQVSGRDLDYFFQQWVYQPTIPDYHFGFDSFETDSGWVTDLQLKQVQSVYPLFQTDIDVRFVSESDSTTIRLTNDRKTQNYRFVLPYKPTECKLDPENWIVNQYTQVELALQSQVDTLPAAAVGQGYSVQLTAIGGQPPLTWSAYSITKPDEFTLSESGMLSGIPADTGTWEIGVRMIDSSIPVREGSSVIVLDVRQQRGDIDSRLGMTLTDILFFVRYLYLGGPTPDDSTLADADCDGAVDIVDLVTVLNYLYQQGPPPCFVP